MKKYLPFYLFLALASALHAQTYHSYYVAVTGNDNADGSIANPWQTIQHGVNQLQPGDTLNIMPGTYYEKIAIHTSGTANARITIRQYQNPAPRLSGANSSNDNPIIWTDQAYITIQGLHLTDNQVNYAAGFLARGGAHHIRFLNNKVSKINFSADPNAPVTPNTNATPVLFSGDGPTAADSIHHIVIAGNEVFDNRTGYSENIALDGNVSHFLIDNNHVHDNTNIGIDMTGNYGTAPGAAWDHARYGLVRNNYTHHNNAPYSTAAGIYVDGGHHIIVENNFSHDNGYGAEIGCEQDGTTEDVLFRNNVLYHNAFAGIHIGAYDPGTSGDVIRARVYNNTLYHNDTNADGNGELILTLSHDCEVFNNIFFLNGEDILLYAERDQHNMRLDYNLIYSDGGDASVIETTLHGDVNGGTTYTGLPAFYQATGYGVHDLFAAPLFADAPAADFHIPAQSPAVNAGDPGHIPDADERDLDGQSRQVEITDIGADEYPFPLPVTTAPQRDVPVLYPNPATGMVRFSDGRPHWVDVTDATGRHIFSGRTARLHLARPGTYFVRFHAGGPARRLIVRP